MRKAPALVVVLGVFAALVTTVPIGYLAVRLIQGWQAALAEILRFRTLELLGNTGLLVLAVTASALVIGFSQAWLTTKTNVVFAAGFAVSAALPLAIPSYVMALSYISIFNGLSGFFAAWLVLTLATSPLVFLAVTAALARLDSSSEEVARTLGFGKLQVLFKVTWPQVRTAATASGLLVALYVLGEFGAIALLRYDTFTRAIHNAYRGSFDRTSAAALAVVLLLITLLVIWFERKYRGVYVASKKQLGKKLRVELGIWRLPAALWLGLIAIFSTALPISSLVIWSVQGSSNLDLGVLLNALWGSVQLAGLAGIGIGIFIAAFVAFAVDVQVGIPRFWTGAGLVLYSIASFTMFRSVDGLSMRPSWFTLLVCITGVALTFIVGMPSMVRTRFATPTVGRENLIGTTGTAVGDINPEGIVLVDGAQWRARTNRATPLAHNAAMRVVAIDGITLEVEPLEGAAKDYREARSH